MRQHRIVALVAVAIAVALSAASAQMTVGHLRGVVKDTAGGVLPGVEVRVSRASGVERATVSDARGEFSFLGLEPGRYSITARLDEFQSVSVTADVTRGVTARVSLSMTVASLTETVTVAGESPSAAPVSAPMTVTAGYAGGITGGSAGGYAAAPPPPFNTEAYDRITDNQWTEARRNPLSTFSIDVDTASYWNVRRFLNQGQSPPKDAVRIEELLNYFPFNYSEPRDDKPFAVTTAIGTCPWNPAHRLALIGLQARRIDASPIPPRNLVFLIDVSGSMMAQNKLPLVKASLAMLARNLTDKDRVSIVVYAGSTGLVLPPTSGGDTPTILEALQRLEAGGSTNGGAGLLLAYRTAQDQFIRGGVNRVILATDGDFNVGVTNQGDLLRLIEDRRAGGVACRCSATAWAT